MDKFSPATCELFGHLVFKGNLKHVYKFSTSFRRLSCLVTVLSKLFKYCKLLIDLQKDIFTIILLTKNKLLNKEYS